MSWDVRLTDDRGHVEFDANYTHNVNRMLSEALVAAGKDPAPDCEGPLGPAIGPAWWKRLDGMTGDEGCAYIDSILTGLRSNPDRFRAMNPSNGWGDYDSLVNLLCKMRDAVPEWPTVWSASG